MPAFFPVALPSFAASIAGRIAAVVCALAIQTTIGAAQAIDAPAPSARKLERITEFFNNEIATGKLPGAVVLIQQHGKPVYLKCFGVQAVETKAPMTSDTIFALHSMTKPITSVAAMMLIDAGKLSLADQVSKFIPEFADVKVGVSSVTADGTAVLKLVPPDRPVTIMDLLRHTSGITYDYIGGKLIDKAYMDSGLFDGKYDNKVFAERIARLPLARQPGTLWRYGHSTDVIGRIIEIVSGQTLYQFEKRHIFDSLGMTSTKFVLDNATERARMAEPLPGDTILKDAETERRSHPEWESGGGGLVSSLHDYARFAQMLLNGGELNGRRYLGTRTVQLMSTNHTGDLVNGQFGRPAAGMGFGLGVQIVEDPAMAGLRQSKGSWGWAGAYGTNVNIEPLEKMVTIIMMQTSTGPLQRDFENAVFQAIVD